MIKPHHEVLRVFTIDPTAKGFGFAVFKDRRGLIDWGVRETRENRNSQSLSRLRDLLDRYEPDVVVVEDYLTWDGRRPRGIRALVRGAERLAATRGIETRRISAGLRGEAIGEADASNKRTVAIALIGRFPELAELLPPVRKMWMSEDYGVAVFDAVALGVAFFQGNDGRG